MPVSIGTNVMKLNTRGATGKATMPLAKACREAGPERESRTLNLDPAFSHLNEYHFPPGVTTGQQLADWGVAQVAAANARIEARAAKGELTAKGRKVPVNATVGSAAVNPLVTMTVTPDEATMATLSPDEQREVLMAVLGAYKAWSGHDEVWWAIHRDEGSRPGSFAHMHIFDRPVFDDEDPDRYCNKRFTSRERLVEWHRTFDAEVARRMPAGLLAKVGGVRHHETAGEREARRARGDVVPEGGLDANTYAAFKRSMRNKATTDARVAEQSERADALAAEADEAESRRDDAMGDLESIARIADGLLHEGYDRTDRRTGERVHYMGVDEIVRKRDAIAAEAARIADDIDRRVWDDEGEAYAVRQAADAADDAVADAADAVDVARADKAAVDAQLEASGRALAEAERRRREDEDAAEQARSERERAESERDAVVAERDQAASERDDAKAEASRQRKAATQAKRRRDDLDDEVSSLEQDQAELAGDVRRLTAERDRLEHGWEDDEGAWHEGLVYLRDAREGLEGEVANFERQLHAVNGQIAEARERLEVTTSRGPMRLADVVRTVVGVVADGLAAAGLGQAAAWVRDRADRLRERATDRLAPETRRQLADDGQDHDDYGIGSNGVDYTR